MNKSGQFGYALLALSWCLLLIVVLARQLPYPPEGTYKTGIGVPMYQYIPNTDPVPMYGNR